VGLSRRGGAEEIKVVMLLGKKEAACWERRFQGVEATFFIRNKGVG